jgi:hypothetical protein
MRSCAFAVAVLAFGTSLGGCAPAITSSKVAVDYNRTFARSRDEALVTNILRASAREPLQFSTMGTVTGGVSPTGEFSFPFSDVLGKEGLKVTLKNEINPVLNIVPLENKDFAEGILKPISLETVNYFITQGWDPEFVLFMSVGGVVCSDGRVIRNRAEPTFEHGSPYDAFVEMFEKVPRLPLRKKKEGEPIATVRMPAKDLLALLKEGIGDDRKIDKIEPIPKNGEPTGDVKVRIVSKPELEFTGIHTDDVCKQPLLTAVDEPAGGNPELADIEGDQGKLILQSVESMIFFLGQAQWKRWTLASRTCEETQVSCFDSRWPLYRRDRQYLKGDSNDCTQVKRYTSYLSKESYRYVLCRQTETLLRLEKAGDAGVVPPNVFLRTSFNGQNYFIRRAEDSHKDDLTLTTLSFLNELIALQTNPSSVTSATPVVNVGPK